MSPGDTSLLANQSCVSQATLHRHHSSVPMLSDLFCDGEDEEPEGEGLDNALMTQRAKRVPKPPLPRAPSNFTGLENQGATCYLNALLQCLHLTPELRQGLFSIDPSELGVEQMIEAEHERGDVTASTSVKAPPDAATTGKPGEEEEEQKVDWAEEESGEGVVSQLLAMGFSLPCARRCALATQTSPPGPNPFSAALEHALLHSDDPGMNDPLPSTPSSCADSLSREGGDGGEGRRRRRRKPRLIPLELQRLFSQLQGRGAGVDRLAVSTQGLTERGFQWTGMDGSVQHDAHELNRLLIDALEKSLKHTSGEELCKSLYRGTLANQIECLTCHTLSEREEPYYDLLLQVLGAADMQQALGAYIEPELLDGDNRYECGACQCRRDSHRRVVLKSVPPVLTFSCQRFDIDRSTWERVKVTSDFRFPLAFSMRPFMQTGSDSSAAARAEEEKELKQFLWLEEVCAAAKSLAASLVAAYGADAEAVVREQLADPSSHLYLSLRRDMLDPRGLGDEVYQLFAVILHHGSAYSGHYSAYIRDVLREGVWQRPPFSSSGRRDGRGVQEEAGGGDTALPSSLCCLSRRPGQSGSEGGLSTGGEQNITCLILENSPLHIVLTLIMSSDSSRISSPSSPPSISLADLHASLQPNLGGKKWSAVYQAQHGSLEGFLRHHSLLFEVPAHGGRVAVKSDLRYSVLPLADFRKAASAYSDEELLAMSCLAAVGTSTSMSPPAAEGSWQTSGGGRKRGKNKKRNKNKRSGGQSSGGGQDNPMPSADLPAQQDSAEASASTSPSPLSPSPAEEVLADLLLTTYHGAYFDFNDSAVVPIALPELGSAFQGSSSAYLLIYRSMSLELSSPVAAVTPCKGSGSSGGSEQHPMLCPSFWQAKIDVMNEELRIARKNYDAYMQSISLTVFFPSHFSSTWPVLERADHESSYVSCGGFLPPAGMDIVFDNRKSVEALRAEIFQRALELLQTSTGNNLGDMAPSLLAQALHLPPMLALADLLLSPLQVCDSSSGSSSTNSMFVESPLAGSSQVGDVLSDHAAVFLWAPSESALPGSSVIEVYTSPPKTVTVSFSVDSGLARAQPALCVRQLWFPVTQSVGELCRHVAERLLCVPLSQPSLRVDLLVQTELEEARYGKATMWETRALYKQCCWQMYGGKAKGRTWEFVSLDEFEGEICFDMGCEGGAGDSTDFAHRAELSLAQQEARRRDQLWTIQIKYEDEKKTGRSLGAVVEDLKKEFRAAGGVCSQQEKEQEKEGCDSDLLSSLKPSPPIVLQEEADCNAALLLLKRRLLCRLLGLPPLDASAVSPHPPELPPALLRRLQFRTGHNPGVGLLDNEDSSLKELALYHNATLRLQLLPSSSEGREESPLASGDRAVIRFCVVSGNDTSTAAAAKCNHQQLGTRSLVLLLTLDDPEETLTAMKQRALAQYLAVAEPEDASWCESAPRRMRKTNWADECTDELLFEVARSSSSSTGESEAPSALSPVTVGSALTSGALKDNELLLLEEGELPDRDSVLLDVYLWPPHRARPLWPRRPPCRCSRWNPTCTQQFDKSSRRCCWARTEGRAAARFTRT